MMATQEIALRLPIIESQRDCPLDLKEAIPSACFAAPRYADLPELLLVEITFASKYGKEFIAAATELMPNCGVNRQLIELLSVRAPSPESKLKLLKDIAEEHELERDPTASENELLKSYEDLLNGPTQDVLTAAQAAAETAERAATAARSAASLARMRISELAKKSVTSAKGGCDNPFHEDLVGTQDHDKIIPSAYEGIFREETDSSSSESSKVPKFDSDFSDSSLRHDIVYQRLTSIDDETNFSYPNLFSSQNSFKSVDQPFTDSVHSSHDP